ncbi:MAG: aldose 1-epimerase [Lutibacter sp.]|uniref:aldose 1-epimerase n=1 Tax=Lutibacter sp. TaxID=1925666 RepID=UPI0038593D66
MFQIKNIQNTIIITDSITESYAKILLNLGGSLQELILDDKQIIKNLKPLSYDNSFSSAILFPFTCRIKNGNYLFNNNEYHLELNENNENALHGLVYNKKFKVVTQETTTDFASITLIYEETQKPKGFPFNFKLFLVYTLSHSSLNLEVKVINSDLTSFPFAIGWHPYFYSSDLFNSFLDFSSSKKLVFDDKMIPIKIDEISPINKKIQIKNTKFDDCYIINYKNLNFETPAYSINISSSSNENYFQLYTPNKINTIAIEPMTGPANSFNNKFGLKVLKPNKTYQLNWKIKLIKL